MSRKYLSEIITEEEILKWNNKNVFIAAPMGSGKTTLILTTLYEYAKKKGHKILILEPRIDLISDLQTRIEDGKKSDVITLITYQKTEVKNCDLEKYDYIVIDECQYFLHDSGVNPKTDISYLKLLNAQATKIYMSGTYDRIKEYMTKYDNVEFIEYIIDFQLGVENVWFYDKDETLDWLVATSLQQKYKGIFFINNLEKAVELYKKYEEHAIFCCSKWQKRYSRYRNNEEIAKMLKTGTFGDKSILITTTTLDVGVSIIDEEIRTIVVHGIDDLSTILQCFGRKRQINVSDKPSIYIQNSNNNKIAGRYAKLIQAKKKATNLLKNGECKYIKAFGLNEADENKIAYDVWSDEEQKLKKHINQVRLFNIECQIADYRRMLDEKPDGFRKIVTESFGKTDYLKLDDEKENALSNYLDGLYRSGEKFLDKAAHDKLAKIINVNINGRLCKTLGTINSVFENDLKIPYRITSGKTHKTINGVRKTYDSAWHVVKI